MGNETVNWEIKKWKESYGKLQVYCTKLLGELDISKQAILNLSKENAELLLRIKKFEENKCELCSCTKQKASEQNECNRKKVLAEVNKSLEKELSDDDPDIRTSLLQEEDPLSFAITPLQPDCNDQETIEEIHDNIDNIDQNNIDDIDNDDKIDDEDYLPELDDDLETGFVKNELVDFIVGLNEEKDVCQNNATAACDLTEVDVKIEAGDDLKNSHLGDKTTCSDCHKDILVVNYQRHVKEVHKKKKKPCPHCDKHISMSILSRHIKQVHGISKASDDISPQGSKLNLRKEKKDNIVKILEAGNHDSMGSANLTPNVVLEENLKDLTEKNGEDGGIKQHLNKTKRGIGNHACPTCDKRFINQTCLKTHLYRSHRNKVYTCDLCEKKYNIISNLHRHKRNVHSNKKDKTFKCKRCDEKFTNYVDLTSHKSSHEPLKRVYKCKQCDKQYKFYWSLTNHELTKHSGIQYKCPFCTYVTSTKFHHERHVANVHYKNKINKDKPKDPSYKCKQCQEEFSAYKDLRNHRSSKHGKLYHCQDCPKVFKTHSSIRAHELSYHNENGEELICPQCIYTTKNKIFMSAHIRRIHRKQEEQN